MRTTIDLPEDLLRQAKAHAALSGIKLKDLFIRYVERGMREDGFLPSPDPDQPRQRSPLPVIRPVTPTRIPALTNAEIQAILDEEDAEQQLRFTRP